MYRQKIKLFVFLFLVCTFYNLVSQITVSPTIGCVPLTGVSFSGPAGASGITWNFGDAITSNQASPTHNYTSAGNFTVTYNATVGASAVSYTALVIVHGNPTASFTYTVPSIRCKPLNVPFTSTSSGPAAIASYTWNFGDGGQGSGSNPIWTYNLQGGFFVTLLVTDANGCTSALSTQQGPINVSTPPTVVISSNPLALVSCTAPFTAAFSGSNCVSGSPIPGPLSSYSWNFGNTQTSTQLTPGNITYNTPGVYNVSLTVTDNNNCSATAVAPVSVSQPTLQTTIPGTVCLNAPFNVGFQTNQSTTLWNFGVASPTVLFTGPGPTTNSLYTPGYTAPGIYTITISAGAFPCTAVQTKTIYVEQVVANFTFSPPSLTCSPTFTVPYINQSSTNAISYTWTTTNGVNVNQTSNIANPTFTFTNGSLNPYTIYQPYQQNVVLTVTSANGCVASVSHQYPTIHRPTAWFNKDKKEGCAPLTVTLRDSSFFDPLFPITSYTWNNGAQPPVIVSGPAPPIPNFVYNYTAVGTYTPFLTIQTVGGCIDVSFIDTIHVANPPVIAFTFTPSTVCWNQPVIITNTSPTTTPAIQHWHVDSDAGFFSGCVNNPNPQWNFTHIGVHTFTMSGYLYGCKGTGTSSQSLTVKGPIVQSRYQTNCNSGTRKSINFYSQLQDVANGTINFGDATAPIAFAGVPGSITTHSITHLYAASGNYTATVTATNLATGCAPYTYTMLVTVRDIQANFTYTNVGCAAITQSFNATPSIDVYTGCNKRGYIWYFDNLPPRDTALPFINHSFATTGIHTVLLMVKDENSCVDTTKHTIRISNATPTFTFSSNPICLSSGTVQMINTTAQTPDPVNNFVWDFGDASSLTTTLTSPIHTYNFASVPSQNFTVTVVAVNSLGCVDSIKHVITVVNPVATINASNFLICIPTSTTNLATNTVTFTAPAAYTSYTFSYGDASSPFTTTNNISPHTYSAQGTYTATLIVDIGGCRNTGSVVINAQTYPIPNFSLNTGNVICRDSQVEFTSTSTVASTPSYTWNLSTSSPILPVSPVVWTYTATGQAVITLTVFTSNGCAASISKTLSILGAVANLNLDKQVVCLGNSIKFNIKNDSDNVYMWNYDFGDGSTGSYTANASPTQTITHTYNYYPLPNGTTTVSLSYYPSSDILKCPRTATTTVQIVKIVGNFNRNNEIGLIDYNHCLGLIDQFSNQTPNSSGYTFSWNFGDGVGTASTQNPTYTYPNSGVYTVTLNITDPVNNCLGFAVKNMTINPLPNVSAFARDTCQNRPFTLNSTPTAGTPPFTYTWNPSAGVISPNNPSTSATASNSTTYTLIIKDANNCKNSTTKSVYIQLPPPSFNWDTTVVIGQLIPLNNNSGSNFTYTWNPTTDLSCVNCPNPTSSSTVNITYSVTIADNMGCFQIVNTHTVNVELKGTVDVPTAFTPNGDGANDVIYVDGWGIRKLIYFRIFNRWGQLLFESNDIKIGWDGMLNGVPQNVETYVYQVSADTYVGDGKPFLKTGTFKLIK
ncbi:MAG: PKD domain-containing protein [Bacteroidetes bacterium]|nr:PKD domain-containing protein [Bacteroidota bacterium]